VPTPLCSEAEIAQLVQQFYARVRADAQLGPIFEAQIADWDAHLALLVDFWSSMLLRSSRYLGSPMRTHANMPGLRADLFQRWLQLFAEVCANQANQAMAEQALAVAERIARSLWTGYQLRQPAAPSADAPRKSGEPAGQPQQGRRP
jgi:hemoglobin